MPILKVLQEGFSSGEWDTSMYGAIRNPLYPFASKISENFIGTPQGPSYFRYGFKYHINARAGGKPFMVTFEYTETEFYVLEFTALAMRIHKYDTFGEPTAIFETSGIITDITEAVEGVVTSAGHPLNNGDYIQLDDTKGLTELNGRTFEVSDVTANTFKLKDEITGDYIDTSAGTYETNGTNNRWNKILEVSTPYTGFNDLTKMKVAQFGNVLYIVHPDFKPRTLTRNSETSWTLANYAPTADPFTSTNNYPAAIFLHENRIFFGGTYADPQKIWATVAGNFNDMTTGSSATDAFTFRLTSAKNNTIHWFHGNEKFLAAGTLGGEQKLYGASEQAGMTPTSINNRILCETGSSSLSPKMVDQRLIFVEQNNRRIRALEYEVAREGYEALNMNVASKHIIKSAITSFDYQESSNDVIWGVRSDGVMIGCSVNFRENIYGWHRHSTDGSFVDVVAVPGFNRTKDIWVAVAREINGNTVHMIEVQAPEVTYPQLNEYYTGEDNSADDEAVFLGQMFEAQKLSQHMDSIVKYDGLFPREITEGAGLNNSAITLSAVSGEGVTITADSAAFSSDDVGREVWGADGIGRAVITSYTSDTEVEADIDEEAAFRDTEYGTREWYLTNDEVWGLWHLEGETVHVVADGFYEGEYTVTNGRVQIDFQASFIQVGLKYNGVLQTLDFEKELMNGNTLGSRKNLKMMDVKFINSLGARYGTDRYNQKQHDWQSANSSDLRPEPLFTGTLSFKGTGKWEREVGALITQEKPLPCTVQSINAYLDVG